MSVTGETRRCLFFDTVCGCLQGPCGELCIHEHLQPNIHMLRLPEPSPLQGEFVPSPCPCPGSARSPLAPARPSGLQGGLKGGPLQAAILHHCPSPSLAAALGSSIHHRPLGLHLSAPPAGPVASPGAENWQLKPSGNGVTILPMALGAPGSTVAGLCGDGSPALASQRVNAERQPLIFSLITPNTSPARLSLSLAPRK